MKESLWLNHFDEERLTPRHSIFTIDISPFSLKIELNKLGSYIRIIGAFTVYINFWRESTREIILSFEIEK